MLINIESLTVGERLGISRRRSQLSQRQAAALLGWAFGRYVKAEKGLNDEEPAPSIVELTSGEECRLMRKRADLTLKELQAVSGFKAKWIHRVELGQTRTAQPLVNFWLKHLKTNT